MEIIANGAEEKKKNKLAKIYIIFTTSVHLLLLLRCKIHPSGKCNKFSMKIFGQKEKREKPKNKEGKEQDERKKKKKH